MTRRLSRATRQPSGALALLAVAAAVLAAPTAARTAPAEVSVALLQPTGGSFAAHNALLQRGAAIAASQIDEHATDTSVRIRLRPVPYRPGTSASAVIRTAVAGGSRIVILPCNDDAVPKLLAAAAARGLFVLSPCNPSPRLLARYPRTWPVGMSGNEEVAQLVNYAKAQNGYTGFILTPSPSRWYASSLTPYFRRAAKLVHLPIVGEASVKLDGSNLRTVATAIKRSNAIVVFTDISSPYLSRIVARLRALGVHENVVFYATDGADAKLDLRTYGRQLENVLVASFGFARPDAKQFFKDYRARFGRPDTGSFSGLGFQSVQVLEKALQRSHTASPAALDAVFAHGLTIRGITLADITYRGRRRLPITNAAVARIIRGQRLAIFSSVPSPMPGP
jgi:ABC-type branched-subunit amino acid transport system substrate-binding protein